MNRKLEIIMNRKLVITTVITLTLTYAIGIYFMIKKAKLCDVKIILIDDTIIKGTNVSYHEGVARIKTCDGQRLEMPILNIKIVKPI